MSYRLRPVLRPVRHEPVHPGALWATTGWKERPAHAGSEGVPRRGESAAPRGWDMASRAVGVAADLPPSSPPAHRVYDQPFGVCRFRVHPQGGTQWPPDGFPSRPSFRQVAIERIRGRSGSPRSGIEKWPALLPVSFGRADWGAGGLGGQSRLVGVAVVSTSAPPRAFAACHMTSTVASRLPCGRRFGVGLDPPVRHVPYGLRAKKRRKEVRVMEYTIIRIYRVPAGSQVEATDRLNGSVRATLRAGLPRD